MGVGMKIKLFLLIVTITMTLSSCSSNQTRETPVNNLTVGTVQKEIKLGMSSIDVASVLGSPNIVQTDDNRNEVWIYDKFSNQINTSSSQGGAWFILFATSSRSDSSSSSQKTLTVIVKFDQSSKVKDFSYHTSQF
jgi:outer membrane protein assembly factor BamE (lipoprotein component of BamABCDE complex)